MTLYAEDQYLSLLQNANYYSAEISQKRNLFQTSIVNYFPVFLNLYRPVHYSFHRNNRLITFIAFLIFIVFTILIFHMEILFPTQPFSVLFPFFESL